MSQSRSRFPISPNESVAWSPVEKAIAFSHYIDARRHVGKVYKFSDFNLIAASGGKREIHVKIPSGTYIEASIMVNTVDSAEVYLIELSSYGGSGTLITNQTYNMNRESPQTSNVLFYYSPTDPIGVAIDRATSLSGTIFNGRWNLKNNKSYIIRIVSRAANNYTAIQMMYTENSDEYDLSSSSSNSSSASSSSSSVGLSSSSSSGGLSSSSSSSSSSSTSDLSSSSSWSSSSNSSSSSNGSSRSESSQGSSNSSSSSSSSSAGVSSSSSTNSSSSSSSLGLSSSSSSSSNSSSSSSSSSSLGLSSSSSVSASNESSSSS